MYDRQYSALLNYDLTGNDRQEYIGLVMRLGNDICSYLRNAQYYRIDKQTQEDIKVSFSDDKEYSLTLITKILMGTLGCTPAVDRFDMVTLSQFDPKKRKNYRFNESVLELLWKIAEDHYKQLNAARQEILQTYKVHYPIFKVLDMCLWQSGRYFS